MLKNFTDQGSFYDAEYLCQQLISPDSFYRKFKEIVAPLIKDEDFDAMYCQDNGRPPISPSLMAMATILQFYRGFSDREMETACMFDLQIKYALGLKLDERPFDHSSLGNFRERMLKNGREKEVFDRILSHLIEAGLVKRDEIQRIDATHIIADIAIPTVVTLVKKGIFNILKPLKNRQKGKWDEIAKEINIAEYSKATVNQEMPGRMDMEKRKKKLVEVVGEAKKVLERSKEFKADAVIKGRIDGLRRILRENIKDGDDGMPSERDYKDKPKDIMVSPIDPDARYGAKSKTKRFMGYKAQVTESVEGHFITNIMAMRGNVPDGDTAVAAIVEQRQQGLVPAKVIGDTAYGDGTNRKSLKENGTEMVAPLRTTNTRTRAVFPKSMFQYDEKVETLTCPQGVTTKAAYMDWQKDIKMFHFPVTKCGVCPVQKQCTNDKDGRRTVGISKFNAELRAAEIYNKSDGFKRDMRMRPMIEGKLSELKRYHGLTRAKYRGLRKMGLQCYFTAAAVNIKRWIKLALPGKAGPPGLVVAGV